MHIIEKVVITGLWGEKTFSSHFGPNCNFLIGKNGSGKTTIINLISAVLNLDFSTIEGTEFKEITLKFGSATLRTKPELKVTKEQTDENLYSEIKYYIRKKSSEDFQEFELNDADQRILMRRRTLWRHAPNSRIGGLGITAEMHKIVKVTWLPIYRQSTTPQNDPSNREFAAPIDAKINDLSNNLARYFSSLGSEVKKLEEKVQRAMFLSLLSSEDIAGMSVSEQILEEEKEGLTQIFRKFNISEIDYRERLDAHFKLAKEALHAVSKRDSKRAPSMEAMSAFLSTHRINYVVQEWNQFLSNQENILKRGDDFLASLNDLIETKEFSISPTNELTASVKGKANRSDLPLSKLSSGEKQLLVILGEALLQNGQPTVYIADEPELSLHVEWQEALVPNIKKLNPSAQIIFATHSPDIVGEYDDCAKDVFDLLK